MPEPRPLKLIWPATFLVAAVIVYGSLYPFTFRNPGGDGALIAFLGSIGRPPRRGDAIASVLLYMPLGFFFVLGIGRGASRAAALAAAAYRQSAVVRH